MAISDKIRSIETHLRADYKSLEKLGETATNKNIENIAGLVDSIYDKFPKTSYAEGTEITLSNTLKGKLDFENDIVGYGQTEQESTEGYNLIDTNETIAETTKNGITYSLKNGVFTFNGTASAGFDIYLNNLVSLKSGNYTFGPRDENGSYTGIFDKYANTINNTNIIDGGQVRGYQKATLNSDYENVRLHLFISSGAVFTNYSFKLLLVNGQYTSSTMPEWEPYTNGASPNPSFPQDIEVLRGTQTVYIKDENNNVITTTEIDLGEYEFARIGNHVDTIEYDVDEDKVYKNENVGRYQFTGNETIEQFASRTNTVSCSIPNILQNLVAKTWNYEAYCNYLIAQNCYTEDKQGVFTHYSGTGVTRVYLGIDKSIADTSEKIKTWLGNTKPILYYQRTLIKKPITSILKDQIKALYNAHSNNGTTIITSNGELPLVLKVRALKGE